MSVDNIRNKIADLRELGFADPVKMITSRPTILDLAIDNICGKIADLHELGFADPVTMIASTPAILTYAIDNGRAPQSMRLPLPSRVHGLKSALLWRQLAESLSSHSPDDGLISPTLASIQI